MCVCVSGGGVLVSEDSHQANWLGACERGNSPGAE